MTGPGTDIPRRHRGSFRLFASPLATLGVFVLFAGMLFWTKLRLVSDIPRTAYAVPKDEQSSSDADPNQPASASDGSDSVNNTETDHDRKPGENEPGDQTHTDND